MPRLTIPALQTYCRVAEAVVTMKRGTDIYRVTASEVRCLYMSDQTAPLDPRIVFKLDKNVAFIDQSELVSFGEGLVREQKVLAGGALSPNVYRNWEDLTRSIDEKANLLDVPKTELTLRQLLEAYGFVAPEAIEKALAGAQDGETLGLTLIRTKSVKLEELLMGAIGPGHYFKPKNHVANDIGRALISQKKITAAQLKGVIPKHVKDRVPLEQILLAESLVKQEDLDALDPTTIDLPEYDKAVEFLVRNGKITRSELLHYTLRATKRGSNAIAELVTEQKVTQEEADMAQRMHDCKAKARLGGNCRLGEILIELGLLTDAQLIERLQYQVEHAAPLGALLVAAKMITPERLVEALIAQDDKLGDIARKEAKKIAKKVEAAPPPQQVYQGPQREVKIVVKTVNWREGAMVLGVLFALTGLGVFQGIQMTKPQLDKPDPYESEPINPIFAFFAGDQRDEEAGFLTAEDMEGQRIAEVERAAKLDPQYAEQLNRLGSTKKNQDKEVEAILSGESDLIPVDRATHDVELSMVAAERGVQEGDKPPGQQAAPVAAVVPVFRPTPPPNPARPVAPAALTVRAAVAPAAPPAAPALPPAARPAAAPAAVPAGVTRPLAAAPVGVGRPAAAPVGVARPVAPAAAAQPGALAAAPAGVARPGAAAPAVAEDPKLVGGAAETPVPVRTPKPLPPDKALNMQALADLAAGATQKARDTLARAVTIAAENPIIVFNLGVADYKLGQYAPAARGFGRARQFYEAAVKDINGKVEPYLGMERLPAGERPFKLMKALIRANTLLADTVTYQGRAREGLGESMDARRFYREAANLYRKNAQLHKDLGDLHRRRNDIRNAISEYAAAAKGDPRYPDPWKALSLVAVEQKKEDLANRYMAIYRRLSGG